MNLNELIDAPLARYKESHPHMERQDLMRELLVQACGQFDLLRSAASNGDGKGVNEYLLQSVVVGLAALRAAGADLESMITEASTMLAK